MSIQNTASMLALMFATSALVGCGGGSGSSGGITPDYEVTASVVGGSGGTVTPASQLVKAGDAATVTVEADTANGYFVDTMTSNCGETFTASAELAETTYTTARVPESSGDSIRIMPRVPGTVYVL